MKVIVAMDSFKGSMSSIEAGEAVRRGILKVFPEAEIVVIPMADGGEGTISALVNGLNGELIEVDVLNPSGKEIKARYGILNNDTAIIEIAQASGLTLIDEPMPFSTNTYGSGQLILDALDRGIRNFIIGLGGSGTTEGGIGMMTALGVRFLDKHGKELPPVFESLGKVNDIDLSQLNPKINESTFLVASDVTNPLTGKNGAISVFGIQKGVRKEDIPLMDQMMKNYARIIDKITGRNEKETPGAGAAGGLGFAFLSFFENVTLKSGIDLILDYLNFTEEVMDADYVITGEGRLDSQTVMGKVPVGIAKLVKKVSNAKTIAFAGSITDDAENNVIDAFFPTVRGVTTLDEAMESSTAKNNLERSVEQVFRLIK